MCCYGTTSDSGHITAPDPEGNGAAAAMQAAIDDAGIGPESIDYINAHGTSTPLGDRAETTAIKRVFGDHAHKTRISSTKGALGHSLGASGGIEAVILSKTVHAGLIPPTINYDTPDSECDLQYTPNEAVRGEVNYGMSNSFGFGGHNACIVFARYKD